MSVETDDFVFTGQVLKMLGMLAVLAIIVWLFSGILSTIASKTIAAYIGKFR